MTEEELKQKLDEFIGKPFDRWYDHGNQYEFKNIILKYVKQFLSDDVSKHTYADIDHNNIVIKMFGDSFRGYVIITVKASRKNLASSRWDTPEWSLKSYELPDGIEERCAQVNEMVATSNRIKDEKLLTAKKDFETLKGLFPDKSDYEIMGMIENILKHRYDIKD